jgi:hypothetical protein
MSMFNWKRELSLCANSYRTEISFDHNQSFRASRMHFLCPFLIGFVFQHPRSSFHQTNSKISARQSNEIHIDSSNDVHKLVLSKILGFTLTLTILLSPILESQARLAPLADVGLKEFLVKNGNSCCFSA